MSSPNASCIKDFMIGRQPILNRSQSVFGYELLFRSATENPTSVSGDRATTEVILNTFSEVGLENLVGSEKAFINLTYSFLNGELPLPFLPSHTVLEVLENVRMDKPLREKIKYLATQGYIIALDDVTSFERVRPMIGTASIVKLDFPYINRNELPWLVRKIRENGLIPLAEKVETSADYRFCRSIGFELFQGYFFAKPSVIHGNRIDSSRMVILQALVVLQNPNVNYHQLAEIIQRDVTLSYKLLKLTNSAYFSQRERVNSIGQSIRLIGITQLSGWLTLMMISSSENKPHELTTTALLRAKLCELLGKRMGFPNPDMLFMMGLFSVLDALFDMPIEKILASLPIDPQISNALLIRQGSPAQILNLVFMLEAGQLGQLASSGISAADMRETYIQAIRWTQELISKTEATLQSH